MARRPKPNAQRRKVAARPEQRVIRVLREGATESEYLAIFDLGIRAPVRLVLDDAPISNPLTLVQRAATLAKESRKAHRKTGLSDFDEIWCVFDRDEHPNLSEAMVTARDNDIKVAFSNPCFELWLVLHQEDQTAWVDRHVVQRRAEELGLVAGKHLTDPGRDCCRHQVEDAIRRARALDARHERNGSPSDENPSSSVWRLIERLRST